MQRYSCGAETIYPLAGIFTEIQLILIVFYGKDSLPRTSATSKAEGYKLYPYFGGDESAPHDIFIYIKEL